MPVISLGLIQLRGFFLASKQKYYDKFQGIWCEFS